MPRRTVRTDFQPEQGWAIIWVGHPNSPHRRRRRVLLTDAILSHGELKEFRATPLRRRRGRPGRPEILRVDPRAIIRIGGSAHRVEVG